MLALSPITIFQQTQKELAAEHQAAVRTSALAVRLSFALAEMAGRQQVTTENLLGARMFVNIFLNLAEKPEVPKPAAPDKSLGSAIKKPKPESAK